MSPLQYLREASKHFPKLSYAWGLVGVGAAGAIIASFVKESQFAIPLVIFAIAGMFVLALFAKWVSSSKPDGKNASIPAQVLVWVCVLAFSFSLFAVLSAAAFGVPDTLARRLFSNESPPIQKITREPVQADELRFVQLQFNNFGYRIDSYHIGAPIRIGTRLLDAHQLQIRELVNQFPANNVVNPKFENPSDTPKTFKVDKLVIFQIPSRENEFTIELQVDILGFTQAARSAEQSPIQHLTNKLGIIRTPGKDWNMGSYSFRKLTPPLRVGLGGDFKSKPTTLPFVDGELDFTVHEISLQQSQNPKQIANSNIKPGPEPPAIPPTESPLDQRQSVAAQDYVITAKQLLAVKRRNDFVNLPIAENQMRTAEERLKLFGIDKDHPAIKRMMSESGQYLK